jgi:hypothetical protein
MTEKKAEISQIPTPEQIAKAKEQQQQQVQKMLALAKIYEETLEPKVVLLFRRMEEMIAAAQMPLIHINLVLDLLKFRLVGMADVAYVTKGSEKLMSTKGGSIG